MFEAIKGLFNKTPKGAPLADNPARRYETSTTRTRREAQAARDEERMWVSKAIPDDVAMAKALGRPEFIPGIMRRAKGNTYDVGNNLIKRTADRAASSRAQARSYRKSLFEYREAQQ